MKFDPNAFYHQSRRSLVYGKNGMVASSSPLSAQAGLEILKKGGNAIDAAIATAAAMTVVEPNANGIGGDCFSIFWFDGKMYGLNSSGQAPERMSVDAIKNRGYEEIPQAGLCPVTVPGAVAGWDAMNKRFGKLTLSECLEPAAKIAEEGYPVSAALSLAWGRALENYRTKLKDFPEVQSWFDLFAPKGRHPEPGEVFSSPDHAKTLREVGRTNSDSFYKGEIAEAIDEFSRKNGGFIRKSDLENHQAMWVTPISVNYRGIDVWEIPPNGDGMIALMALNILENFDLKGYSDIDTYHKQIEALKLAFTDGLEYIGDPRYMKASVEELLSKEYAKKRASLIGDKAIIPTPGHVHGSGTVYFATADKYGNMVSFIQSNYMGFGSGIVVPGYGISLHNRGCGFNLKENHPNCLMPGKRPFHTIIPGFLTKGGKPIGPIGIMGGFMQPQAHLQVISSLVDFNLNPQDALNAPRWQWVKEKNVKLERTMPIHAPEGLARMGHNVEIAPESPIFGRGQLIVRQNGVLIGATEPRTDGHVAVW